MDHKVIHAWIFARGGSKGLPGKNIRPLCGKPLISYAVELAGKSKYIQDVFISTDSEEIAETAEKAGAHVPFMRPAELAQDSSPERLAWRHAITWNRNQTKYPVMDVMVSLPATAPLRSVAEVDRAIELFLQGGADTVIAVSPSDRHPCFNMVYMDANANCRLIIPTERGANRQDFPKAYDISTAVYVTEPDFVLSCDRYMDGRVKAIEIPAEDGIDIDSLMDFKIAEAIMEARICRP